MKKKMTSTHVDEKTSGELGGLRTPPLTAPRLPSINSEEALLMSAANPSSPNDENRNFGNPPIVLDLGQGTHVRLDSMGAVREEEGGGLEIPLSYTRVRAGQLSERMLRRRLNRWFNNALWDSAARTMPDDLELAQRCERNRRWNAKHVRHVPADASLNPSTGEDLAHPDVTSDGDGSVPSPV